MRDVLTAAAIAAGAILMLNRLLTAGVRRRASPSAGRPATHSSAARAGDVSLPVAFGRHSMTRGHVLAASERPGSRPSSSLASDGAEWRCATQLPTAQGTFEWCINKAGATRCRLCQAARPSSAQPVSPRFPAAAASAAGFRRQAAAGDDHAASRLDLRQRRTATEAAAPPPPAKAMFQCQSGRWCPASTVCLQDGWCGRSNAPGGCIRGYTLVSGGLCIPPGDIDCGNHLVPSRPRVRQWRVFRDRDRSHCGGRHWFQGRVCAGEFCRDLSSQFQCRSGRTLPKRGILRRGQRLRGHARNAPGRAITLTTRDLCAF